VYPLNNAKDNDNPPLQRNVVFRVGWHESIEGACRGTGVGTHVHEVQPVPDLQLRQYYVAADHIDRVACRTKEPIIMNSRRNKEY